jgi:CBS domain-containing protein
MTKDVGSCGPDGSLNRAAQMMWERDCGFVPVVDHGDGAHLVGVVTDRDACMVAYTRGQPLAESRVGNVMSKHVQSCKARDDLAAAEATMREGQIHRLPVVDESEQLMGVISLADIARVAAQPAGSTRPRVTAAEIGETLASIRRPWEIEASGGEI